MEGDGPGINRPVGGSQFKSFLTAEYFSPPQQHTNLYFRMSKAPQVSDLVVQPNVTFKAVTGGSPHSPSASIPIAGADDSVSRLNRSRILALLHLKWNQRTEFLATLLKITYNLLPKN